MLARAQPVLVLVLVRSVLVRSVLVRQVLVRQVLVRQVLVRPVQVERSWQAPALTGQQESRQAGSQPKLVQPQRGLVWQDLKKC